MAPPRSPSAAPGDRPASYSVAPGDVKRSRILSGGALMGIAVLAMGALVLVFPKRDLLSQLRDETDNGNHDLTVAYLQNIIRTEPADLALRLLLVEKMLAAKQLDAAQTALAESLPLAQATPAGLESWEGLELAWWQAQLRVANATGNSEQANNVATQLLARLTRHAAGARTGSEILGVISAVRELASRVNAVATHRLVAEASDLQDQLLFRLLKLSGASEAELSRGASVALIDGSFAMASNLFFAARRKTTSPDVRDKLLQKGVQALLAAGQSKVAWRAALRESQPLTDGGPNYWFLADLALGAGEPKEASLMLRRVIQPKSDIPAMAKTLSDEKLELAWSIFAAAGDLNDALKVADAALVTKAHNAVWLERSAKASEWLGLAPRALAAWVQLLKLGASKRALSNVFRLSPMLYDDDALLVAWLALSRERTLTTDEIGRVVAVYERIGSVEGALGFLRAARNRSAKSGSRAPAQWAGLEAQLLDRAGRSLEAVTLLETLRPLGLSRDDAMQLATLHLRKGRLPRALRALQAARLLRSASPPGFDQAYWELLADVAYDAGELPAAEAALDHLLALGKLKSHQAERAIRLRSTAGKDSPRNAEALPLAARIYPQYPNDNIVFAWLDAISNQQIPTGLHTLMAVLGGSHRKMLEKNPLFLVRRAGLYVRLAGAPNLALAKQDYQQALALQPENTATRISYWWLLMDQQDIRTLRGDVYRIDRSVFQNPAYAEVLSSVWQALNEPLRAVTLMRPMARSRSDDFLWLVNYAEVLDRAGRAPAALHVRRHAWMLLRRETASRVAEPIDVERARQALISQLRLAGSLASGEEKARLWRSLGILVGKGVGTAQKGQAEELVTAWLISEGRFDAMQRWLWRLQVARMATPAYQAMAAALSQNDLQSLTRLADDADASRARSTAFLEPQDRVTALRQLQRSNEAVTLDTEQALSRVEGPSDDNQLALKADLITVASRADVQIATREAGALRRRETVADVAVYVAPSLKLTAELNSGDYRSIDRSVIASTPRRDREARLGFEASTPWGKLKAQASVRSALNNVSGLYLQQTRKLTPRTTLQLTLARNQRSDESSAMSVAGMRDRAEASLNVYAGDRLNGLLSVGRSAFRTQTGAALGTAVDAVLVGNWTLRRDYPDVRLQTQFRRSVVKADGQPDTATALLQPAGVSTSTVPGIGLFLGPSSTALSTSVGLGLTQGDTNVYSSAWRPWGEVGFEIRQTSGGRQTQGLLRIGAKGALTGRDQLSINLDVRPGTGGLSGATSSRELRLKYELFFDR